MQIIKELTKSCLYAAGYYSYYFRIRRPQSKRLLILMYHDLVANERSNDDYYTQLLPRASHFEAHVRYIAEHYRVLSLRDAVTELSSVNGLSHPTVAITFDDGYESTYRIAFPILRRYAVSALFFSRPRGFPVN